MKTDPEKNRGSLERIKVHVTFAAFTFDPPSSKVSQMGRLKMFLSELAVVGGANGIDEGWDIRPDFDDGDDCRCEDCEGTSPKQYIHAYGWRWETDGEYKERLETNLFYKKQAYDNWLIQSAQFSVVKSYPSQHFLKVEALESAIRNVGK